MRLKLTIKIRRYFKCSIKQTNSIVGLKYSQKQLSFGKFAKSSSRNYMFGNIMNTKFIKLSKPSAGFKAGDIVSIADIYDEESASNIAGLIIYRLWNSGLTKQPTIVEA